MNYNPSVRSEFVKNPESVKSHHKLVEDPTLRRHFNLALAEMQRRAADSTNPANFNECAASHLRLLGAQDFIETFYNLAETPVTSTRTDTTNLPGNMAPMRKN